MSQQWIFRVGYRMTGGDTSHTPELPDVHVARNFFDQMNHDVPGPSIAEVWIERRLVSEWERWA